MILSSAPMPVSDLSAFAPNFLSGSNENSINSNTDSLLTPPTPVASSASQVTQPSIQTPKDPYQLFPLDNLSPKLRSRIEHIVRLRVNRPDLKDGEIATMVGVLQVRLSVIYSLPEYKEAERMERRKLGQKLDSTISDNIEAMNEAWKMQVPQAMQGIFEAAQQKKDLRARMEACKEILDRDPRRNFVKKSVSETTSVSMELSHSMLSSVAKEGSEVSAGMNKVINVTPDSEKVLVG